MLSKEKKYLVDNLPVTPEELIQTAREAGWRPDWLILTSEAAQYLRAIGCEVARNPETDED